jgi:hypothetical protein
VGDLVEGGVEDHVGALIVDWAVAERLDLLDEHLAQPADLGLEMPSIPSALTRSSTLRVDTPLT